MSIKFGEIDANQILDNEFRVSVLEKLLEWILNNNYSLTKPTPEQLNELRGEVVENLKRKYPNSGIAFKRGWYARNKFNNLRWFDWIKY